MTLYSEEMDVVLDSGCPPATRTENGIVIPLAVYIIVNDGGVKVEIRARPREGDPMLKVWLATARDALNRWLGAL